MTWQLLQNSGLSLLAKSFGGPQASKAPRPAANTARTKRMSQNRRLLRNVSITELKVRDGRPGRSPGLSGRWRPPLSRGGRLPHVKQICKKCQPANFIDINYVLSSAKVITES